MFESRIVDSAVYVGGRRVATMDSIPATVAALEDHPDGMAWIGLYRPDEAEVHLLAEQFDLHPLAVEDAIHAHQRPKLERYDETLFVVLRPARYRDDLEEVEFGEVHVFTGERFVLTVRHSEAPEFRSVRLRLESQPDLLSQGPEAVMYSIIDQVVDGYYPVVAGLGNDIDEIEVEVFSGDPEVSRRIYELSREVADFQRATGPLGQVMADLSAGFDKYQVDEELQRYLRDVEDHLTQISERVEGYRAALRDMLTVNATLVAQRQNEEMRRLAEASNNQSEEVKKISAWAAILFAPTLIGTVYGMNFENMPELGWGAGYPIAIGLMGATCLTLYLVFKRRNWL
ncbi:MAG: magnesium and cobalt transport protein CorA [Actinobacteria bacterium]|nr:magnesium and cobalt transport protein CorA [Actinomycetota bacterium]